MRISVFWFDSAIITSSTSFIEIICSSTVWIDCCLSRRMLLNSLLFSEVCFVAFEFNIQTTSSIRAWKRLIVIWVTKSFNVFIISIWLIESFESSLSSVFVISTNSFSLREKLFSNWLLLKSSRLLLLFSLYSYIAEWLGLGRVSTFETHITLGWVLCDVRWVLGEMSWIFCEF